MGFLDRIESFLDRLSTCPACGHNEFTAGCACGDRRCVCRAEREGDPA
ncbi:hypothetical protein M8C13_36280 [Crossiella sp. SN42]|nr:hypothetical protein [Crossiella sp. SN42]MCO1581222.1 hypothetical protein [Crossiella sp. SN42]